MSEMRGPVGVRSQITAYLRDALPVRLLAVREAWGLADVELPLPVDDPGDPKADAYFNREPTALDRWPLVAVTSGRVSQRAVDFDLDFSSVYQSTCPIRVYSWVNAGGRDDAQVMRDNFATAVRVAVLSDVQLGSNGDLSLTPSSLVMDFSDVSKVKGDRFVAGSYVGFDVSFAETLTDRLAAPGAQPRDTVSTVTASSSVLPPTP